MFANTSHIWLHQSGPTMLKISAAPTHVGLAGPGTGSRVPAVGGVPGTAWATAVSSLSSSAPRPAPRPSAASAGRLSPGALWTRCSRSAQIPCCSRWQRPLTPCRCQRPLVSPTAEEEIGWGTLKIVTWGSFWTSAGNGSSKHFSKLWPQKQEQPRLWLVRKRQVRELPYKVSELGRPGWESRGLSPGRPTQPDPANLVGLITILNQIKSLPEKVHVVIMYT